MKFRALVMFFCSIMLLISPSASAAAALPGQLPIAQVHTASAVLPMQQIWTVTDDNPATFWDAAAGGAADVSTAYIMLGLQVPAKVTDIWLRIGDQTSAAAYHSNGYPTQVTISIWQRMPDGSNAQAAQYTYTLNSAYNPGEQSAQWQNGYQRLPLPVAIDNAASVVLSVTRYTGATAKIADVAVCGPSTVVNTAPPATQKPFYDGKLYGELKQKIATRSGPGTQYTEPGTFLSKGDTVQVISLVYDENDVPWVQVDFTAYGGHRRAYTGLKRIDLTAEQIPEERPLGYAAVIKQDVIPRSGPGRDYRSEKDYPLAAGETATVISRENGWVQLELARPDAPMLRVWVEENAVRW